MTAKRNNNSTSASSPEDDFDITFAPQTQTPGVTPPPESKFRHQFIVDSIFPAGRVHLWSGATGVGKTTLLLQTIADWRDGKPVFGCESFPLPFCYIACDRPIDEALDALERLGIDPADRFPLFSAYDSEIQDLDKAVERALQFNPKPRVLFLDGITEFFKDDPNRLSTIRAFFSQAGRLIRRHKLTIVATICASKVKEGERYLSPRQRIAGSAGSGARASTVIEQEAYRADDPADPRRTIHILMTNSSPLLLHFTLDESTGRHVMAAGEVEDVSEFQRLLFARGEGARVVTSEIEEIGEALGIDRSTAFRKIGCLIKKGKVTRDTKGVYTLARTQ